MQIADVAEKARMLLFVLRGCSLYNNSTSFNSGLLMSISACGNSQLANEDSTLLSSGKVK